MPAISNHRELAAGRVERRAQPGELGGIDAFDHARVDRDHERTEDADESSKSALLPWVAVRVSRVVGVGCHRVQPLSSRGGYHAQRRMGQEGLAEPYSKKGHQCGGPTRATHAASPKACAADHFFAAGSLYSPSTLQV